MLTERMQTWISCREERWNILLQLKLGEISLLDAEKKLREIDGR